MREADFYKRKMSQVVLLNDRYIMLSITTAVLVEKETNSEEVKPKLSRALLVIGK